jgi:Calx-beta domain
MAKRFCIVAFAVAAALAPATSLSSSAQAQVLSGFGIPFVSISPASVVEGNTGTSLLTFTVSLSRPSSQPVAVLYENVSGSATRNTDFVGRGGIVTFERSRTSKTVTVSVNGDTDVEADEEMQVVLRAAVGARIGGAAATGTIVNDDIAVVTATGLVITPNAVTVAAGQNVPISASIVLSDGTSRPLAANEILGVIPSSYDPNIAAALSPPAIQGVAVGTTTITYFAQLQSGVLTTQVPVTVTAGPECAVTSFRIRPIPLPVGGAFPIWGFCEGSTTEVALNLPVVWSVSNPRSIDVNPTTGVVINNDVPGSSVLTATLADGRNASLPLAVRVHVVTATGTPISVGVGGSAAVSITATLNDGTTVPVASSPAWAVDNPAIATYSAGTVMGVSVGSATLLAGFSAASVEPLQTFPLGTYVFGTTGFIAVQVPITVS